jgi:hypothetical protein
VSEPDEPEFYVPASLASGAFANDVEVYRDLDYTMLDFVLIDPRRRERTIVVARLVLTGACILKLKHELEATA